MVLCCYCHRRHIIVATAATTVINDITKFMGTTQETPLYIPLNPGTHRHFVRLYKILCTHAVNNKKNIVQNKFIVFIQCSVLFLPAFVAVHLTVE